MTFSLINVQKLIVCFEEKYAALGEQTNLGKQWSIKHEVLPNRTIWKHNANMRGLSLVSYITQ